MYIGNTQETPMAMTNSRLCTPGKFVLAPICPDAIGATMLPSISVICLRI